MVTKEQLSYVYANEADLLNVAPFGKTAKQWCDENPDDKGNIRDYATLEQLVVLSNMESINALLIPKQVDRNFVWTKAIPSPYKNIFLTNKIMNLKQATWYKGLENHFTGPEEYLKKYL